jgi:hypothetical protein
MSVSSFEAGLHNDPAVPSNRDVQKSVLFATLDDLSIPHHLANAIASAAQWTHKRLIIIFVSKLFGKKPGLVSALGSEDPSISHTQKWNEIQSLLTFVYVQATSTAQRLNRVLMEVDVLLKGIDEPMPDNLADGVDILYRVHHGQFEYTVCPLVCFDTQAR